MFIKELLYVITDNEEIVGHVIHSKALVKGESDKEVLCMGPFSIIPEYQKRGFGEKLLKYPLSKALELGYGHCHLWKPTILQ